MKYTVNDITLTYDASGKRCWGRDETLLAAAIDLTKQTSWKDRGFTIEKFYSPSDHHQFQQEVFQILKKLWITAGLRLPEDFQLDQYHRMAHERSIHLAAVEKTKLLSVEAFPLGIGKLEDRISAICKVPLRAKNPFDGQSIFHFRVIRPSIGDNNPLHRDVWLEDYKDCINLYIPVAGSSSHSSLIILPGSHRWPESKVERTTQGAVVNGVKFNVPAVTAIDGDFEVVRPDPKENEVLVFSPYLIHGGAVNLDPYRTRISIEVRLWKK